MIISYYVDTAIPTKRANMVHVMRMCQAFSDLGHKVTLYCDRNCDKLNLKKIRGQYSVSDQFDILTVRIPDFLCKYGHRLAAYYGAWKKSRIQTDGAVYSRSAATLFFLRKKVRFVYEAHMEPDSVNRWIESHVLRCPNCAGLVVISNALKKRYLEIFPFLTDDKIMVLHDAADVVESDVKRKAVLKTGSSSVNIGYVGHLYPGKCMETLIPLAKRCQNLNFHIVGGTEEWITYWKAKDRAGDLENIFFYGYVDNCKVGSFYNAFDIVILPFSKHIQIGKSKGKDIGKWISPLKLFEAMAYGKPILVSRLETIEEVMSEREDCIMAEPDSIDDWVEKLTELCSDVQLQQRIGAAALEKLKQEYTWLDRARRAAELLVLDYEKK